MDGTDCHQITTDRIRSWFEKFIDRFRQKAIEIIALDELPDDLKSQIPFTTLSEKISYILQHCTLMLNELFDDLDGQSRYQNFPLNNSKYVFSETRTNNTTLLQNSVKKNFFLVEKAISVFLTTTLDATCSDDRQYLSCK